MITFPATLKQIGWYTFEECYNLKTIYVADGCEINFSRFKYPASVNFKPLSTTAVKDMRVHEFRKLRRVTIPEVIEKIGAAWFYGSQVESVTIPACVREIGAGAFYDCDRLKTVVFKASPGKHS